MSKHTPGPWGLPDFARPDTNCSCGYVLVDGYFGAVATVHASGEGDIFVTGDNPKFDEAVANARLIAAAPDLLAALQQIQRMGYADVGDRMMVDKVIAKATGESA